MSGWPAGFATRRSSKRPHCRPILSQLARVAGLKCAVPIFETPRVSAPAVWGLVRPCVLVPPGLIESLPKQQLDLGAASRVGACSARGLWGSASPAADSNRFLLPSGSLGANRAADVFREFACDDASLALIGIARRDCGAGFLAIAERACIMRPSPRSGTPGAVRLKYPYPQTARAHPQRPTRGFAATLLGCNPVVGHGSRGHASPCHAQAPADRAPVKAAEPKGVDTKARPLTLTVIDRRTGHPLADAQLEMTIQGVAKKGQPTSPAGSVSKGRKPSRGGWYGSRPSRMDTSPRV